MAFAESPRRALRSQHVAMRVHLAPQFIVMTTAVEQVRQPAGPFGEYAHPVTCSRGLEHGHDGARNAPEVGALESNCFVPAGVMRYSRT